MVIIAIAVDIGYFNSMFDEKRQVTIVFFEISAKLRFTKPVFLTDLQKPPPRLRLVN